MGGYGAFKLALTFPDRFAAAASLSGALDLIADGPAPDKTEEAEWKANFGSLKKLMGGPNDLRYLALHASQRRRPLPRLYQCCGTEDFLYPQNLAFRDLARSLRLNLTYDEGPGDHDWAYWDQMIQRVLEWLPLRRLKEDDDD
jgi:S-formylglutathione hydrolase FrmB